MKYSEGKKKFFLDYESESCINIRIYEKRKIKKAVVKDCLLSH